MSSRIYMEDTVTIALLYNFDATGSMMLSLDKIKEFDCKIDGNLEEMSSKVNMIYPIDLFKINIFYIL